MHSSYRIALVSLALLALSTAAPPASAAQAPGCEPPPAGEPIIITGKGQTQSAPFQLDGGAYTVDWTMADPSTILSFIHLQSTTDASVLQVILNASGKDGSAGQTHVYKVKPGSYYLSVRAPSGWTVTLTPIAA